MTRQQKRRGTSSGGVTSKIVCSGSASSGGGGEGKWCPEGERPSGNAAISVCARMCACVCARACVLECVCALLFTFCVCVCACACACVCEGGTRERQRIPFGDQASHMVNAASSAGSGEAGRGRHLQRDPGVGAGGRRSECVSAGGGEMGALARKQVRAWTDDLREGGSSAARGGGGRSGARENSVVAWEEASRQTLGTRHRSSSNPVPGSRRAGSRHVGGAGDDTVAGDTDSRERGQRLRAKASGSLRDAGGSSARQIETREKLVDLLDERGSFPAGRRIAIWQQLLQVPFDDPNPFALSCASKHLASLSRLVAPP